MAKQWQCVVTHELLNLTPEEIKEHPQKYKKWFADLDNPTEEEVADYFDHYLQNMSDEWELAQNGKFKVVEVDGEGKESAGEWRKHDRSFAG